MMLLYSSRWTRKLVVGLQTLAFRATNRNATFGPGLRVWGWPIAGFVDGSTAAFGRNLRLVSHSFFSAPGVNHPCILRTLTPHARITVGNDVGMSGCTICAADSVTIGDQCLLGANVLVADTDFHPLAPEGRRYSRDGIATAPIEIGANVFIGANTMILKGVTVGANAVIGAGSVVTDDVPADSIVVGVPARVVGVTPVAHTADESTEVDR